MVFYGKELVSEIEQGRKDKDGVARAARAARESPKAL